MQSKSNSEKAPGAAGQSTGPLGVAESIDTTVDALLAASRALVAVSARSIADSPEVTFPQFRMLVVLSHGSSNLSELASSLDVAASTALRMVDRLIAAGFVERLVRPDNRRETNLSLTKAGERVFRTVTRRRRRDLRAVVERVPERDRPELARAMALFASAAEEFGPITDQCVGTDLG